MIVLGIDPGSRCTGYSVVQQVASRFQLITAGVIQTNTSSSIPQRLSEIYDGLQRVITHNQPTSAAIESIFAGKSAQSALLLGQARGTALVVLAKNGLDVSEYNPMTIKKAIAGHGRAGKPEVIRVVKKLVGSTERLSSDAADATAIAITHLLQSRFHNRLQQAQNAQRTRRSSAAKK